MARNMVFSITKKTKTVCSTPNKSPPFSGHRICRPHILLWETQMTSDHKASARNQTCDTLIHRKHHEKDDFVSLNSVVGFLFLADVPFFKYATAGTRKNIHNNESASVPATRTARQNQHDMATINYIQDIQYAPQT